MKVQPCRGKVEPFQTPMQLTRRQRKIWTVITVAASLALLLTSLLPILLSF